MDAAQAWKVLFEEWPSSIPRQGMVIATTGEVVAFIDFLVSDGLLLVERDRPDALGARKVMVPYGSISLVKMTSTAELAQFRAMGFEPPV